MKMIAICLILMTIPKVWAKDPLPKVLIFGKTIKPAHERIIPLAGKALVGLAKANGFEPTFSDDLFSQLKMTA